MDGRAVDDGSDSLHGLHLGNVGLVVPGVDLVDTDWGKVAHNDRLVGVVDHSRWDLVELVDAVRKAGLNLLVGDLITGFVVAA